MTTDFDGLDEILKKDMYRFLDAMKDTLIPMLDLGLDEELKANLIRSVHGLKSISGMYELHQATDFIIETEEVIHKIFAQDRKDIANDLLNDMFVIKDQIEVQFKYFLETKKRHATKAIVAENAECLEEFIRHYVEYKNKNSAPASVPSQPAPNAAPAPAPKPQPTPSVSSATPASAPTPAQPSMQEDFKLDDNVMYFTPTSLHKEDATRYQKLFVDNLDNVKEIRVDLSTTNRLDISGVQFVQAIKKHCKVSGIKYAMVGKSELVELEEGMLGVEL
jgi:chemotaxis protein histidine kinase CheA